MDKTMDNLTELVNGMDASDLRSILVGEEEGNKGLMLEGGNMFEDVTRIHQENVAATLKYIYEEILPAIGIDRKYVQPLGSTGKRLPGGSSGDIDLGIDCTKVDYLKDAITNDEQAKAIAEHAKPILDKMGIESRLKGNLYSIRCPIQNFDGKQEGEFVQLDMMTSRNMKFQVWSQYAPKEIEGQKYIKGCIRNLIFEAAAHAMDDIKVLETGLVKFKDGVREDMVEWEEYSFYTPEGLNIKHCKRELAKNKSLAEQGIHNSGDKSTRSLVTDDPDQIAKKMFGPKVKGKDLMTWDGAWEAAHKATWAKDEKKWRIFLDSLKEKIQVKIASGMDIPQEMLDELGLDIPPDDDPGGKKPTNESTLAKEGGHRISNATRMNQANAKETMARAKDMVMKFFGLGENDIAFLGSTGKKLDGGSSGDIDIAISKKSLEMKTGITSVEEWFDAVEEFGETNGLEVTNLERWGFQGTSIGFPISNVDGEQEGEIVQLDLIPVDNLKFQAWGQFGPEEIEGQKYVKGLVRNQIITAAARVSGFKVLDTGLVNGMGGEQPTKWERYSYTHEEGGLFKKTFERPLMKGKKGEEGIHVSGEKEVGRELVSDDPDEICEILFGVDSANMLTWEDAWNGVKKQGILEDPEKMEQCKKSLKMGIERPLKKGSIDYLPPELEDFLGLKVSDYELPVDESIKSTKDMAEIDTPRQEMTKIHQLTGTALKQFLHDFIEGVNDSSLLLKTTPKIDGYPFRVAWLDGKVMMELSYSGLMDKQGVESNKGVHPHERNFYDYVESHHNKKMAGFLHEVGLEGVKLIGELLANGDDFKDDNGTITYVGTTYDANKLGAKGSLVVIDAKGLTKERTFDLDDEQRKKVINFACSELSDSNASYLDIGKFAQEVELTASDFSKEVVEAFNTANIDKMKKQEAEELRDKINAALTDIMKRKFKNPDIMPEGDGSLEGVAFELKGKLYGIHYQSWKDIRNGYFSEIDEMKDFTKLFLARVTDSPDRASLVQMVNKVRQEPEKYQDKYAELLPKFIERAQELVKNAETRTDLPKFIDKLSKARAEHLPERFDPSRLTTDVMSLVEMIDGKVVDQKGKTIALIPGSFRPPHKGHLDMIKHYAEICDEVIVAVSGQTNMASQRYDKLGRAMPNFVAGEILEIYCKAAGLDNVQIAMTLNPMNWISATVRHFSNCKVMFGLSKKDDISRFSAFTTDRFKDTLQNVEILPIEENAIDATTDGDSNISATYVRDHIDDKEALRKVLPSELSDAQFEEVYKLMNPESGDYPSMTDQDRADKFNKRQMVKEGGHAETSCPEELRDRIHQENVEATLDDIYKRLLPKLGLTKDDVASVGSTGKKLPGGTSGDIDLAMPQDKVMKGTGCETPEEFIDYCQDLFKELDVYDAISKGYGWKSVSCFWPIANVDGKQEGKFVQLDFVVTSNMKFVTWGMHSDQEMEVPDGENPDDVNPKGAVRMILLKAIAMGGHKTITKTADIPGEGEGPIEMERYDFKFNEGLYKVKRERPKRKRGEGYLGWKVVDRKFVTDDPDEIIHILFNDDSIDSQDLMTLKDVYHALMDSPMWEDDETRHEIGRCFNGEMEQHKGRYGAPSWLKFN